MANVRPQTARIANRTAAPLRSDVSIRWGIKQGAIGGIIGGIIFAMFEMIASAVLMGPEAFFMPLRMIGAIVLGPAALDPSYSLVTAGLAGLVVHMMLSAIYGAVLGTIVAALRDSMLNTTVGLLVVATLFGIALWLVNFFVIAPALFPWFTEANQGVQFISHAFFFGTALGIFLDRAENRRLETMLDEESKELGEWALKGDPTDTTADI